METLKTIRVGVVGFGNMGSAHSKRIYDGAVRGMKLQAVCDIDEGKRALVKEDLQGVETFADYEKMMTSGHIDAVIIATPHYLHCPIAICAFSHGLHVLSEKPAGVYTKQIAEMNDAAKKSGKVFCIMFNQRTNPLFRKAHDLVQSGELGELKRMVWIITNWYRTQAYYDSGSWRATWAGEGGGVLLNQAPHQLDLWQWICGMPKRVRGFCSVAKYHDIEVEDDATIYAEYENGAVATFITSTGEFPGTNRLEISGDKGKIVIENKKLTFTRLQTSEREFCFSSKESFAKIPTTVEVFEQTEKESAHTGILQNFANAILYGEKLIAEGYDGIREVTLSNAAYLSSWNNDWVDLPIDEEEYYKKLQGKIQSSRLGKTVDPATPKMEYSERWSVRW